MNPTIHLESTLRHLERVHAVYMDTPKYSDKGRAVRAELDAAMKAHSEAMQEFLSQPKLKVEHREIDGVKHIRMTAAEHNRFPKGRW